MLKPGVFEHVSGVVAHDSGFSSALVRLKQGHLEVETVVVLTIGSADAIGTR